MPGHLDGQIHFRRTGGGGRNRAGYHQLVRKNPVDQRRGDGQENAGRLIGADPDDKADLGFHRKLGFEKAVELLLTLTGRAAAKLMPCRGQMPPGDGITFHLLEFQQVFGDRIQALEHVIFAEARHGYQVGRVGKAVKEIQQCFCN